MEIMEIIKDAMVFPSKDLAKLAVYIVLAIVGGILAVCGFAFIGVGIAQSIGLAIIGIVLLIAGLILGFIVTGYQVSVIKSGIDQTDSAPEFIWKGNMITGIKYVIVNIVYFIIPAIIVLIVGWATNLFGLSYEVFNKMMMASINAPANTTVVFENVIPQSQIVSLGTAITVTGLVALVLFIIFALIATMGQSRLANTDSIGEAINIPEAVRDMGRIGFGKVIAVVILVVIIVAVINAIITGLNNYIPGFAILSIIVTPYLLFFSQRATGLLYSDIA